MTLCFVRRLLALLAFASAGAFAQADAQALLGDWRVGVDDGNPPRHLQLLEGTSPQAPYSATYGWLGKKLDAVTFELQPGEPLQFRLVTPARSVIQGALQKDGTMAGTFETAKGRKHPVRFERMPPVADAQAAGPASKDTRSAAGANTRLRLGPGPHTIDFVHMGGNDCPPCIWWRMSELPKLQQMPEFKLMRFTYVTKTIGSRVPDPGYFPEATRHLQPALLEASNKHAGSPHEAILVDGKVVDYWFGSAGGKGDATEIARMVRAIANDEPLPRPVCRKLAGLQTCRLPG